MTEHGLGWAAEAGREGVGLAGAMTSAHPSGLLFQGRKEHPLPGRPCPDLRPAPGPEAESLPSCPECVHGERKGRGPEPTEEAPGTAAGRGEGFTFLGSAEEAYLFKEPQGEPFGQTVKFLNCLLPWCLNKLQSWLPGQSQEGGRPLFLMARHDALLPSPGGLRPGLPLDLAINHLGGHLWAAASEGVGRPQPGAVFPQLVWPWT